MTRTLLPGALLLALVLLASTALASWRGYAGQEPDNQYDADGRFMFLDAPEGDRDHVYLNVFATFEGGLGFGSSTLGSRMEPTPQVEFDAVLGVWADCNHDGYIGFADGAMREYRAELSAEAGFPVDAALCPELPDKPAYQGQVHNDGSWITEMIPIGTAKPKLNARYLQDADARIWGDNLAPVTPDAPPQPDGCAQTSYTLAPGEAHHTGGLLHHADCLDGNAPSHAHQRVVALEPALGAVPDPQSLYTGGPADAKTFGDDEGAQRSFVSGEQDCSAQPVLGVQAVADALAARWPSSTGAPYPFTPGQFDGSGVRAPRVPTVSPGGNVPGTVNETVEESPLDDCKASDDSGHDFYGLVESGSQVATDHKTHAQLNFRFLQFNNRYGCDGASHYACGTPNDAGMPEIANYVGLATSGDYWYGGGYLPATPDLVGATGVDRATFALSPDVSPADVWTFHGLVTLGDVRTPGSGTYGDPWCTSGIGRNAGTQHGWECDPAQWTGTPVGETYNLRDVDCYDNTVVSARSGASPTGADVGARSVPATTQAAHGCW
jgi:hypothetical protein